jgi:GDP-L-fucose synthase
MKEEHLLTGPLEPTNEPYAIAKIAALIRKIHDAKQSGGPVPLWGDRAPLREFLHVDDLADALIFLAQEVDAEQLHALVPDLFVNVGTGSEISIRDLATLVAEVEGYEGEIHWDTTKPNGTPRKLMDGLLMQKLGWEPKIGLREGIGATYEWFVESGRE